MLLFLFPFLIAYITIELIFNVALLSIHTTKLDWEGNIMPTGSLYNTDKHMDCIGQKY